MCNQSQLSSTSFAIIPGQVDRGPSRDQGLQGLPPTPESGGWRDCPEVPSPHPGTDQLLSTGWFPVHAYQYLLEPLLPKLLRSCVRSCLENPKGYLCNISKLDELKLLPWKLNLLLRVPLCQPLRHFIMVLPLPWQYFDLELARLLV